MINFEALILILLGAFLVSLMLVPLSTKIAWKVGAIDLPTARGAHVQPIPRLGGLAIVLAIVITLYLFLPHNQSFNAFVNGLLIVAFIGAIDDIHRLPATIKLLGQIVAALVFIITGGGIITNLGDIFGIGSVSLGWAAVPFTVLVIVGGINTINLSDGLDGLAAGFSVVVASFLVMFAYHTGATNVAMIAIVLIGACLGFLRYNTHPAKLFMGDIGSLSLGYSLATLLVQLNNQNLTKLPLVTVVLAMALPILDTLLVMTRRILHGQHPFSPDKTHLHHRLLALNIPHGLVVSIMYLMMASFGIAAVLLHEQPEWFQFVFLFVYGVVLFGAVILLQHSGFDWKKQVQVKMPDWMKNHQVAKSTSHHSLWVNRSLLVIFFLPALFFSSPQATTGWLPLAMSALLLLVIWSHRREYERVLIASVYVAIVVLLFEFNLAAQHQPIENYSLWFIAGMIGLWVAYKLIFCQRLLILFTTGFELLLLMLVWFIPFVMLPLLNVASAEQQHAVQHACLQSVPILLLVKLHFTRDNGSHYVVLSGLIGALMLTWFRGSFAI